MSDTGSCISHTKRFEDPAPRSWNRFVWGIQWNPAKTFHEKSRLLIYDSLFRHTHIVRKLTLLGVQKCGCVGIGYSRKKVIRSQSAKNGLILYEDFELGNEVTVTFPIKGIFQNFFNFKLPHTHSIAPATWHDINPAGYRAVAPTQTQPFSCIPPYAYWLLTG